MNWKGEFLWMYGEVKRDTIPTLFALFMMGMLVMFFIKTAIWLFRCPWGCP